MSYQLRLDTEAVIRLSDNAIIGPEDKEDWKIYQAWLKKNNIPLPPEPLSTSLSSNTALSIEEKMNSIGLTKEEVKTWLGL